MELQKCADREQMLNNVSRGHPMPLHFQESNSIKNCYEAMPVGVAEDRLFVMPFSSLTGLCSVALKPLQVPNSPLEYVFS